MEQRRGVSRRKFLQRAGAGALLGATLPSWGKSNRHAAGTNAWAPPPNLANPNILVIMVDQMRMPAWLNAQQKAALGSMVLPNIIGRLQNNAYNFQNFFAAAAACTPARAALLTGLYAPQTAMYITGDGLFSQKLLPPLNPAYPTWGQAVAALNSAYQGNLWWFGKWHLCDAVPETSTPLAPYGFNTRTYPGGPTVPYNPSPNGAANEGLNGGLFANNNSKFHASDADITSDFIGWLQGQAPTNGTPPSPWCATVSLINPHDIAFAPGWLQSSPFPPTGIPLQPVYFQPPSGSPPSFYTAKPHPWNFEKPTATSRKPSLQYSYFKYKNQELGVVSDWVLFLNQYYWLQNYVDQQVGLVLDALASSSFASNTIVIFMSDHGEYAGSHGLHDKGYGAYDESMHVPLSVQFPGQSGAIPMNQMCSAVDFFGLVCDFATGGTGQWASAYPDLAARQSIWSFLYRNAAETRVAPDPINLPYVFHTFDEVEPYNSTTKLSPKCHIVCMRTANAKLAYYWQWAKCSTYPTTMTPDPEFYNYAGGNTAEMGNDYFSSDPAVQQTIAQYTQAMGTWGPPGSGLIASELSPPLIGTGNDGNPLTQALTAARQNYFNYAFGKGKCIA